MIKLSGYQFLIIKFYLFQVSLCLHLYVHALDNKRKFFFIECLSKLKMLKSTYLHFDLKLTNPTLRLQFLSLQLNLFIYNQSYSMC